MYLEYPRVNADGSRNVWCRLCKNYIGAVSQFSPINHAICAICQADANGEDLTPEDVRRMRMVRINGQVMSMADAFPEVPLDPLGFNSEDPNHGKTGRANFFFRAATKAILETIADTVDQVKKKITSPTSGQLARAKRSPRVFDRPLDEDRDENLKS